MPLFAHTDVARLEQARNVRALLRLVRLHQRTEPRVLLAAIHALGRLKDPRAASVLRMAYAQQKQHARALGAPVLVAYGSALAALGDLYALRPLAHALTRDLTEHASGLEPELEQAARAVRLLGRPAFDVVAPTFAQWAVPRALRTPAQHSANQPPARQTGATWAQAPIAVAPPEALAWLTADSAYLVAGASGDARAIEALTPVVIDHLGMADGADGAALALGWLGARQAVEPLVAALLMVLSLERFTWLREAHVIHDLPGTPLSRSSLSPLPLLIQALMHDLDAEAATWARSPARPHGETSAQLAALQKERLQALCVSIIVALGRLRCQQAVVPLLLATLLCARQESLLDDRLAHAVGMSLRCAGGFPMTAEVAQSLGSRFTFSLVSKCIDALRQFGVDLPARDPLYSPALADVRPAPAARVFALFPTRQLRVLVRFATNSHLRQLVREELASRKGPPQPSQGRAHHGPGFVNSPRRAAGD